MVLSSSAPRREASRLRGSGFDDSMAVSMSLVARCPTGPGSEEIHVDGRVVENAANDFLDVPKGCGIREGTR